MIVQTSSPNLAFSKNEPYLAFYPWSLYRPVQLSSQSFNVKKLYQLVTPTEIASAIYSQPPIYYHEGYESVWSLIEQRMYQQEHFIDMDFGDNDDEIYREIVGIDTKVTHLLSYYLGPELYEQTYLKHVGKGLYLYCDDPNVRSKIF